jgi:PmbA protein
MNDLKRDHLIDVGDSVVRQALSAGADVAEALVREGSELSARVRMGSVEMLEEAMHHAIGLRVIRNGKVALTSSSDLSESGQHRLVLDALELADLSQPDAFAGPADSSELAQGPFEDLTLYDPSVDEIDGAFAIDAATRADQAARQYDRRITNMHATGFSRTTGTTAIVLSNGFRSGYERSMVSLSSTAVADDGNDKKRRGGWYEACRYRRELVEPEEIGREAARRTLRMLGARSVPSCEVPVIFPQETASAILSLFASCVVGSSIWRKSSYLAGREASQVASELVTIVDEPFIAKGFGSRAHDGEGLRARANLVVERGRLRAYLCDLYSGRKLGRGSTGSASRGSAGGVGPSTSNFILQPVKGATEQDIIADTKRGFYVTEMMGFGFNATTGDFSRGASGMWIENGKITHPVSEVTISLNLDDILKRIDAVAEGFRLRSSTIAPSFRVSQMTLAGN